MMDKATCYDNLMLGVKHVGTINAVMVGPRFTIKIYTEGVRVEGLLRRGEEIKSQTVLCLWDEIEASPYALINGVESIRNTL